MKFRYLTGVALAAIALIAVQSHAQNTSTNTPPAPPVTPDGPVAAQPGDQVCDVEATVNGVTTKYHYVVRTHDGGDTADLPAPPPGTDGAPDGGPDGAHMERRQIFMYRDGDQGGPHDGHGGPMHMFHMMDMTQLDADKDGKVTFTEFTAPMQDMFNHLDANHDGSLSADELPKPGMGGPGMHDMGPGMGPGMHDMPPPLPPECAK